MNVADEDDDDDAESDDDYVEETAIMTRSASQLAELPSSPPG